MSELLNYLPLFLVLATLVTGVLWGHDRFRRRPQRPAAAAALDERTPDAARGPAYEKALLRSWPIPAMEWAAAFSPCWPWCWWCAALLNLSCDPLRVHAADPGGRGLHPGQ